MFKNLKIKIKKYLLKLKFKILVKPHFRYFQNSHLRLNKLKLIMALNKLLTLFQTLKISIIDFLNKKLKYIKAI